MMQGVTIDNVYICILYIFIFILYNSYINSSYWQLLAVINCFYAVFSIILAITGCYLVAINRY